jgi:hypothetical protein
VRTIAFLALLIAFDAQAARILGTVVDPTHQFIPNATVRVLRQEPRTTRYRAFADANGRFTLEGISPGKYRVAITSPGFRERFLDADLRDSTQELDLGSVNLDLAGCTSPSTACNDLSRYPKAPLIQHFNFTPNCDIDADSKTESVLPHRSRQR